MSQRKKAKTSLTALQKKKICQIKNQQPWLINSEIANKFNCGSSTVGDIIREKDIWLAINEDDSQASSMKRRLPKWPELEEALSIWVERILIGNRDIDSAAILNKAKKFAAELGINNFKGSEGWLAGFKKRHGISSYLKCGESLSAPPEEDIQTERLKLRDVLQKWDPENIFNCDESALYWSREPNRVLAKGQIKGRKRSMERVTVFFVANSTGTEKLPVLLINKSQNPRALRGINKNELPVHYYWNRVAWMQVSKKD